MVRDATHHIRACPANFNERAATQQIRALTNSMGRAATHHIRAWPNFEVRTATHHIRA